MKEEANWQGPGPNTASKGSNPEAEAQWRD